MWLLFNGTANKVEYILVCFFMYRLLSFYRATLCVSAVFVVSVMMASSIPCKKGKR